MKNEVSDSEHMNCLISALTDQNFHISTAHKANQLKMVGTLAEIFGEGLLPYLPRVIAQI